MRSFLSPIETRLLRSLPLEEADVIRALYEEFDAVLIDSADDNGQETLFDTVAA